MLAHILIAYFSLKSVLYVGVVTGSDENYTAQTDCAKLKVIPAKKPIIASKVV